MKLVEDDVQVQAERRKHWLERIRAWRLFSVDVETNPQDQNRIFKLGAVRSSDQRGITLSITRQIPAGIARELDELAVDSRLLLGHNLRLHDLVELKAQYPTLQCTQLPILDTLELSTIAFPNNPYHRLIKGYKLVSDSKNEPERDARITLDLLVDELVALEEMGQSDSDWVTLMHFLLRSDGPLSDLLQELRGSAPPTAYEAQQIAHRRFQDKCCQTALSQLTAGFQNLSEEAAQAHKELVYALERVMNFAEGGASCR